MAVVEVTTQKTFVLRCGHNWVHHVQQRVVGGELPVLVDAIGGFQHGTAWRGVGVYHITLTVPSRQPLFGTLITLNAMAEEITIPGIDNRNRNISAFFFAVSEIMPKFANRNQ